MRWTGRGLAWGLTSTLAVAAGAPLVGGCFPRIAAVPGSDGSSAIRFREISRQSGIHFEWGHRGRSPLTIRETFGTGCAFLDFNRDRALDVLLVGPGACRLYLGNRNSRFADVTRECGLESVTGDWTGCAVGDVDHDGWPDIYLTGYHCSALLRSDAGRRVHDLTLQSGTRNTGWGSSAGFADLDGDGDLDLYVGNYVVFGPGEKQYCSDKSGLEHACPPQTYRAEHGRLFRNLGGPRGCPRFRDITRAAGLLGSQGKVMGLGFRDFNDDGRTDFYVANDVLPGELWQNRGGLRFADVGASLGVAFGPTGQLQAGMGVDWADFDRDQDLDLVVTTFAGEPYSLYRLENRSFTNATNAVGVGLATRAPLGFGTRFADFDNDGWVDLVFANGHVYDTVERFDRTQTFRQIPQILRNGGGWYEDVTGSAGADIQVPVVGRGLATGDYDRDGREDFLLVDNEGRARLFHNETRQSGHWVRFSFEGTRNNRLGYGVQVDAGAGSTRWVNEVTPVGSYLSSSDASLHFGLGPIALLDEVLVRWPDGKRQRFVNVAADREWVIHEERGLLQGTR